MPVRDAYHNVGRNMRVMTLNAMAIMEVTPMPQPNPAMITTMYFNHIS